MSKYDAKTFDEGFEKPESSLFKYGKVGDVIKGTLMGFKMVPGKFGPEEVRVYEIKAEGGQFHPLEDGVPWEKPIEIEAGVSYSIFEKPIFADEIRRAKPGQKLIIRYLEDGKSKSNGKVYKVIECKLGGMDESAVDEFGDVKDEEIPFV